MKTANNYLTKEIIRYLQEAEIPVIEPPSHCHGRMEKIRIKGPFTPLETTLYGLTKNSSGSPHIEVNSVNHVLLENEPNDMSEKYLVAVSANQNDEHSSITVRQTTLMPNIRLFGPLMAAIFAPQMKLLRNEAKTDYIKMITGLGLDQSSVCLSEQTTMSFDLDVELKNSDIETVIIFDNSFHLNSVYDFFKLEIRFYKFFFIGKWYTIGNQLFVVTKWSTIAKRQKNRYNGKTSSRSDQVRFGQSFIHIIREDFF